MNTEDGWFTLSLVLIAYLFLAFLKRGLLIKDKEIDAPCALYLPLSKSSLVSLNPLTAKISKWSNTLKQFVSNLSMNCLSVFDHFVGLALKGLTLFCCHKD